MVQDRPIWIAKPTGKAQGRGIFLFTDLKEVKLWKKAAENRGAPKQDDEEDVENYVVQRYISDPLLIGGKKFDMRIYVLVTSYMPLNIWLYRQGFARFSAFRFNGSKGSLKDTHLHLTNVAVQKTAPGYDRDSGCKWFVTNLKNYLLTVHGKEKVEHSFWLMQMLIIRTLLAVQKTIMHDKHCFELYGYDIMLDADVSPRFPTPMWHHAPCPQLRPAPQYTHRLHMYWGRLGGDGSTLLFALALVHMLHPGHPPRNCNHKYLSFLRVADHDTCVMTAQAVAH